MSSRMPKTNNLSNACTGHPKLAICAVRTRSVGASWVNSREKPPAKRWCRVSVLKWKWCKQSLVRGRPATATGTSLQ